MEITVLKDSIAYCGLVCGLCDLSGECSWCRSDIIIKDKCDKHKCIHRRCCLNKGLDGCWECDSFPCHQGRFTNLDYGQTVSFNQYIRDFDKDEFIRKLLSNEEKNIRYGLKGTYKHKSLETVNLLLRSDD